MKNLFGISSVQILCGLMMLTECRGQGSNRLKEIVAAYSEAMSNNRGVVEVYGKCARR
jgi:hypothetical protein